MNRITGKELYLRKITLDDTSNIVKWRNTQVVRGNFIFREEFTETMHLNWMKNKVETGEVIQYIICLNDNTPIGSVYFRDINTEKRSAEFGIFIGEESELGKGYGLEATSLFIKYGFEYLNFDKILLRVIDSNNRAAHVYEKVGFIKTSTDIEVSQPSGEQFKVIFMEINKINASNKERRLGCEE